VLDERTEQAPVEGTDDKRWINRKTRHRSSREIFTTINLSSYND
jgi:hypothetical protein